MCCPRAITKETSFGRLIIPRKDLQQTRRCLCSLPQDYTGASISEITMLFGNYLPLILDCGTLFGLPLHREYLALYE